MAEGKMNMNKQQQTKKIKKAQWFPIYKQISGKLVILVGGGQVALRRVRVLLNFDCRIRIISPELCTELETLAQAHRNCITVERHSYYQGGIIQHEEIPFFVIASTSNRETNKIIGLECTKHGVPVSVADCKEESTFYFPAVVVDENIIIGLSAGGENHKAVRKAADKLRRR